LEVVCGKRCVRPRRTHRFIADYLCRISYSVFFAAFDMTRRIGLRVKALFGGPIQTEWSGFLSINTHRSATPVNTTKPESTPTIARIAQATTIVTGGIAASLAAEVAGRPIRACQRILDSNPRTAGQANPVFQALRTRGLRPFLTNPSNEPMYAASDVASRSTALRIMKKLGWKMAAVGPWGFGFLVWAWVGGEV
jgi:hypothetical protein